MARGIISTILGGLAGGFEGRRKDLAARQEQAEREREEERRRAERESAFAFQAAMAGATHGAQLRPDEAASAADKFRSTNIGRVLDQAPLFERPSERPVSESALEAAFQTRMPSARLAAEAPRIAGPSRVTEDKDYFQLSSPGGQVYSMMTPEARARQQREVARSASQEENTMAYETLRELDPRIGEYNPGLNYDRLLDRKIRLEELRTAQRPVVPEPPAPTTVSALDIERAVLRFAESKVPEFNRAGLQTGERKPNEREIEAYRQRLVSSFAGGSVEPRRGLSFPGLFATPSLGSAGSTPYDLEYPGANPP